jgi:hypothetical protein
VGGDAEGGDAPDAVDAKASSVAEGCAGEDAAGASLAVDGAGGEKKEDGREEPVAVGSIVSSETADGVVIDMSSGAREARELAEE